MLRQKLFAWFTAAALSMVLLPVHAQQQAPDALIRQLSTEVLDSVKGDKSLQTGDTEKVMALVENKILPYLDFKRMTASSVGRYWRKATAEQQERLQEEFKTLLVRTYSGALAQVKDQTVQLKPMRASQEDTEVLVRTEIRGKGEPIQIDYRMEKSATGWKIYDVNVMGVWLVENYRNSFAQEIGAIGIDGLIGKLSEQNKAAANRSSKA